MESPRGMQCLEHVKITPDTFSQASLTPEVQITPPLHAAQKVFHINELLEKILIEVDMKTLLLAHRVDKNFNMKISQTRSLQKKLFKLPATAQELHKLNMVETREMVMMDSRRREIVTANVKRTHNVWKVKQRNGSKPTVVLNPLLVQRLHMEGLISARLQQGKQSAPPPSHYSWMEMSLVQPQIPELDCSVKAHDEFTTVYLALDGRNMVEENLKAAEKCAAVWGGGEFFVFGRGWYSNNAVLTFYGEESTDQDLAEIGLELI